MSERTIRQKAAYYLRSLGCKVIALEAGDGWPDILAMPYRHPIFFVEFKSGRKGHGLQPNQVSCRHSILGREQPYALVDKWDDRTKALLLALCGGGKNEG